MRLTSFPTSRMARGWKSGTSAVVKTAAAGWENPMARTGDCAGESDEAESQIDGLGGDSDTCL